jgi:hypothetical protein
MGSCGCEKDALFLFWSKSRHKAILPREYLRGEKSVYADAVRTLGGSLHCLHSGDESRAPEQFPSPMGRGLIGVKKKPRPGGALSGGGLDTGSER